MLLDSKYLIFFTSSDLSKVMASFFVFACRDQNLLTWTDSAIYIFTPQNGQVLLWTEVKGAFQQAFSPSQNPKNHES